MKYRKRPVVIEAITFDEMIAHGIASGANIVNGMPWSFQYKGHPITHENDDCYLIPTLEGTHQMKRGDMLITGIKGEIYPCRGDIFAATYEEVATVTPAHEERDRALADGRDSTAAAICDEVARRREIPPTIYGPLPSKPIPPLTSDLVDRLKGDTDPVPVVVRKGVECTTTDGLPPAQGTEHAGAPKPIDPTTGQHMSYWVMTEAERAKGFVRPVRVAYRHKACECKTVMSTALAETYARDPKFYGSTFCCYCRAHFPVEEFLWVNDGQVVGS